MGTSADAAVQFLYLGADPEAPATGVAGSPGRALGAEQVFPTPLLPLSRYRGALEMLSEWLPREKLHSIPRNMHPQGSRASAGWRSPRTTCGSSPGPAPAGDRGPPGVDQPDGRPLGLPARGTRPRVFVVAAARGASSGTLPDIGYAVTRLLTQLKLPPEVTAFLFLGAPADPTTPPQESANVYATLTELNHYSDESITFRSRYGGAGRAPG